MTTPPEPTSTAPEGTIHAHDAPQAPHQKPRRWLNRTVGGAGLTSALGDFCYETTTVILPGFLAVLGIPAAVLGLIEGSPTRSRASPRRGRATSPTRSAIARRWWC